MIDKNKKYRICNPKSNMYGREVIIRSSVLNGEWVRILIKIRKVHAFWIRECDLEEIKNTGENTEKGE